METDRAAMLQEAEALRHVALTVALTEALASLDKPRLVAYVEEAEEPVEVRRIWLQWASLELAQVLYRRGLLYFGNTITCIEYQERAIAWALPEDWPFIKATVGGLVEVMLDDLRL